MKLRCYVEPPEPMRGLEVPPEVVEALGGGKRPAVTITINGHSWRSRVAIMPGRYLLGLSIANRQAAGARRRGRAVPDLPQRTLALRTASRSHQPWLSSHVCRPHARSKDAAVTSTLDTERASPQSPHAGDNNSGVAGVGPTVGPISAAGHSQYPVRSWSAVRSSDAAVPCRPSAAV